jgi:uncharacterized protein (TIGR03435 family)
LAEDAPYANAQLQEEDSAIGSYENQHSLACGGARVNSRRPARSTSREAYNESWATQETLEKFFAIEAIVLEASAITPDTLAPMMQQTLIDRFSLKVRYIDELQEAWILRVATERRGPKLKPATETCIDVVARPSTDPPAPSPPTASCRLQFIEGHLEGSVRRMADFAAFLSTFSGRAVVDGTGLSGAFELDSTFNPSTLRPVGTSASAVGATLPSFATALRNDLGLRIDPERRAIPMLVVDVVAEPTAN